MIRDYEKGSGFQGALRSLVGERVVAALTSPANTIILCFESGGAVLFQAVDRGAVALRPMSVEDTLAVVKERIRDGNRNQVNLREALKHLGDQKCASKPKTCYVNTSDTMTTSA